MTLHKIIAFAEAPALFSQLREQGKKIVQCHGTFDLVHPGHVYHLEEAKELGDILVVTVTAEKFVNKGPGRPYFNDQMRTKSLAALACVDYVVLVPHVAAVEAIEAVQPYIYCKGREYEEAGADVTGNIGDDVKTVERLGGQIRYIGSVVFSSTRLLNNHFENLPIPIKDFCLKLSKTCPPDEFRKVVDGFDGLKVLVIGEIIFDCYSYVRVQGLTSKNRILSGRFLQEETQAGGSLAVYRHLKQFCKKVDLVSLVGVEPWVDGEIRKYVGEEEDLVVRAPEFTTIIKKRYVEPTGAGKELSKLFAVNYIDAEPPPENVKQRLRQLIEENIKKYDLIAVIDFGHGLFDEGLRRFIEGAAPFMALNCQTNSNNHGFNIISRQYRRCDSFTLDDQELLLSTGQRHIDHVRELESLRARFYSQYGWLTRGGTETIGIQEGMAPSTIIPLESRVMDTVGAGDAFYSIASLAACRKLPIELGTFLGQLAGAQAVRIVGNADCISKQSLLKSGMTLLNF